ncbi:virulence factor Mce family protein [Mycolicibacterium hippocampi]|uniref:Mammalian cell entry protein n=2 Tax=Mycolicibacterium hippocampi TaxID=659824 RepID=A0A7I9ZM56_9MYCO|nr:mammalian cell entry protein [Mycolicibacterium hippocampi]
MDVGTVQEVKIGTGHVRVRFTLGGNTIGEKSRLMIRTDTILGRKVLAVDTRGEQPLRPGATVPVELTTTPYQIYDAFQDATKDAQGWDTDTIRQSLQVLSDTLDQTSPHLSETLAGVRRFADTLGKRDEQVQHLLGETSKVAGVLGIHGDQINRLLVNAQTLISAINQRGKAIEALLSNVNAVASQVHGLIDDNPNLNAVLKQVGTISGILVNRKDDLVKTVTQLGQFVASLSEIVSSGPYVKAAIFNLLPYQMLQPWVDAAFKKRGIDPQKFWRDAGLPAFQFPDPNGQRHANGAPPPAPVPLEGTPDHPGPAVAPGTPCSYTPPEDGLPTPANPLPCYQLSVGPFGDNRYGPNYEGQRPDVVGLPPNPANPAPAPGVPSSAFPSQMPPTLPGAPAAPAAPVAPGPPGARTVPVEPLPGDPYIAPGSLQGDGTSPLPPALVGPPPPPGPGPQLPVGTGGNG